MKIEKVAITIGDLCEGYVNETETDIEKGVYAYGGRLCVRPAFQRSFVYDIKQANAVIDTALKGFPLNIMYWVDNGDGTYDCLDGQQRTISLCNFVDGITSFKAQWFNNNRESYIHNIKRVNPEMYEAFMNYELEQGDSLWSVASANYDEHYDSIEDYIEEICIINSVSYDTKLVAGTSLIIPYYSCEFKY